jgi:hypothetical protein
MICCVFLFGIILSPEQLFRMFLGNVGLLTHGVVPQKMELFHPDCISLQSLRFI